jgi:hypothetical protein
MIVRRCRVRKRKQGLAESLCSVRSQKNTSGDQSSPPLQQLSNPHFKASSLGWDQLRDAPGKVMVEGGKMAAQEASPMKKGCKWVIMVIKSKERLNEE